MFRILYLAFACALAYPLSAGVLPTVDAAPASIDTFFGGGLPGLPLSDLEESTITGGDVFMSLNASRTRLTVKVYTNNDELRRLRPTPLKTFEIDAHNRIMETTKAPYMPAKGDSKVPAGANLTTKPEAFPSGTWRITSVRKTSGDYGPNMISTNAVGRVKVYADGVSVGEYSDAGYAIHSNKKDFSVSKSYGCIVVREADNRELARVLREDSADARRNRSGGRTVQLLNVRDR